MFEVEKKIEIDAREKLAIVANLLKANFVAKGIVPQNDYYVHAALSEFGGYDTKRYRKEGEKYIYTEKMWVIVDRQKTRKEDEYETDVESLNAAVRGTHTPIIIIKDREGFSGVFEGSEISAMIDAVKFDHSPNTRYFFEAEILVEEEHLVVEAREKITAFLSYISGRSLPLVEAPGMFTMAYEKK